MTQIVSNKWGWAPWATLLGGMAFSLFLQAHVRQDVFFSGDGGLKALMARQFAEGPATADLRLAAPDWVEQLWDEGGLYPLEPPFVYRVGDHRFIQYPLPFPLFSAMPYHLFGYRGLYLLPLLGCWSLWIAFVLVCRRLRLRPAASALALAALVFAAPVTIYCAMFWEHTLAVALSFSGLGVGLCGHRNRRVLIGGGLCLGLAVWMREETVCIVAAVGFLVLFPHLARRGTRLPWRPALWFLSGAAVAIATLLIANVVLYGHALGAHGFQVTRSGLSLGSRFHNVALLVGILVYSFAHTFPLGGMALLAPVFQPKTSKRWRLAVAILAVAIVFVAIVPVMLPDIQLEGWGGKQWGPRFLLPAVPLFCLVLALLLDDVLGSSSTRLRAATWMMFIAPAFYGVYVNTLEATRMLRHDYTSRIAPSLHSLRRADESVVAVEHQHIAMELLFGLPDRHFFLVKGPRQTLTLARGLIRTPQRRFVYLQKKPTPTPHVVHFADGENTWRVDYSAGVQQGIYWRFRATIRRTN
jgi:hypothetical protein